MTICRERRATFTQHLHFLSVCRFDPPGDCEVLAEHLQRIHATDISRGTNSANAVVRDSGSVTMAPAAANPDCRNRRRPASIQFLSSPEGSAVEIFMGSFVTSAFFKHVLDFLFFLIDGKALGQARHLVVVLSQLRKLASNGFNGILNVLGLALLFARITEFISSWHMVSLFQYRLLASNMPEWSEQTAKGHARFIFKTICALRVMEVTFENLLRERK